MKKVESAGGVIINELNELVVVFSDIKSWQFPKGTVEDGEEYFGTAIREIKEETGLVELTFIKKLPIYSRVSTHEKDTIREIHYFLFRTKKQNLNPSAEVTDCKWVPIDAVEDKLTYPEDKKFITEIRQDILNETKV